MKRTIALFLTLCLAVSLVCFASVTLEEAENAAEAAFPREEAKLLAADPVLVFKADFEGGTLTGTQYLENGSTQTLAFTKNADQYITFASGEETDGNHYGKFVASYRWPTINLNNKLTDSRAGYYTVSLRLYQPAGQNDIQINRVGFNGATSSVGKGAYSTKGSWTTFTYTMSLESLSGVAFNPQFADTTATEFWVDDLCVWYTEEAPASSMTVSFASSGMTLSGGSLVASSGTATLPAAQTAAWLSELSLDGLTAESSDPYEAFYGWSTTADGTNIVSSVTVDKNLTLYAVFRTTDTARTFGKELIHLTFNETDSALNGYTYTENGKTYTMQHSGGVPYVGFWSVKDGALVFEHGAGDAAVNWGTYLFFNPDDETVFAEEGTYYVAFDLKIPDASKIGLLAGGFYYNSGSATLTAAVNGGNVTNYGDFWQNFSTYSATTNNPECFGAYFKTTASGGTIAADEELTIAIDNFRVYFVEAGHETQAKEETYTVTFDANGVDAVMPASLTPKAMTVITPANSVPTGLPLGKRFIGWSREPDGEPLGRLYVTGDVTLYALYDTAIPAVDDTYGELVWFEDFETSAVGTKPTSGNGASYAWNPSSATFAVQSVNGNHVMSITGAKGTGKLFSTGVLVSGLTLPGDGEYTFVWDLTFVTHDGYNNIFYRYTPAGGSMVQGLVGKPDRYSDDPIAVGETAANITAHRVIAGEELSTPVAFFNFVLNASEEGTFTVYVDNLRIYFKEYADVESIDEYAVRTVGTTGLRFSACVTGDTKLTAEEYGFLVAVADRVGGDGTALVFPESLEGNTATTDDASHTSSLTVSGTSVPFIYRSSYIKDSDIDISSAAIIDGEPSFRFNAVLTGIPKAEYRTNMLVRPYLKVNGRYYYASPLVKSLYDAALAYGDTQNDLIKDILSE